MMRCGWRDSTLWLGLCQECQGSEAMLAVGLKDAALVIFKGVSQRWIGSCSTYEESQIQCPNRAYFVACSSCKSPRTGAEILHCPLSPDRRSCHTYPSASLLFAKVCEVGPILLSTSTAMAIQLFSRRYTHLSRFAASNSW